MLVPHRLVGLAHVDGVAPVERSFQRVERRAPQLVARQKIGEHGESRGLRVGRRRAQIRGIGGGRPAGDEVIAVIRLRIVSLDRDVSVSEPVGRVLGSGGDRRAGELLGGAEVGLGDRGGGSLAQLIWRLVLDLSADRSRSDAQGLRQAHRIARHVLARERLDLGGAGGGRDQEQKDGERAQSLKHGSASQGDAPPPAAPA